MSLSILRQAIEVERLVGEQRAQLLVKAEAIVSGAGREAVEILMEDARLTMDSAEVQSERVVLGGQ
ncbi:MAG: hypothetical protein GX558_05450, partial [Clostridiales bacterium]|nr:hypothetical protein [Clostridiales bacterium]